MQLPNIPLTTKGDVAAAGLGFVGGFAVDVLLFPAGILPGTIASLSAAGCVSAKNAVDAAWESWRGQRKREQELALEENRQAREQVSKRRGQAEELYRRAEAVWKRLAEIDQRLQEEPQGAEEERFWELREHLDWLEGDWDRWKTELQNTLRFWEHVRHNTDFLYNVSDAEFNKRVEYTQNELAEYEAWLNKERLRHRANTFLELLEKEGLEKYVDSLQRAKGLWENDIIQDPGFEQGLNDIIARYRQDEAPTSGNQEAQ